MTAAPSAEPLDSDGAAPFIGNRKSKKLHYADCPSVEDMKEKNKVEFYSKQDAWDMGYKPCGRC